MPAQKTVIDGISISYELAGNSDRSILLLHGFACTKDVWRYQLDFFSKNYKTVAPDLRGWGCSDKPSIDRYSLSNFIFDIKALMNELGLEKTILVGSSMGGLIAQEFYLENRDRVGAMVLVGTRAHARQDLNKLISRAEKEGPGSIVEDTIRNCFSEGEHLDLIKDLLDSQVEISKDAVLGSLLAFEGFDLGRYLTSYSVPTLIIFGEKDRITKKEEALMLHENIRGSKLEIINDCGHLPMLEKPDQFNSIMREFIENLA